MGGVIRCQAGEHWTGQCEDFGFHFKGDGKRIDGYIVSILSDTF